MKRLVSLLLCVAMVMTVVSFAAAEDRPTVTMMNRLPSTYVVEDNPAIAALEDLLGVNLEIEAPPISSYGDRRNIVLASGDVPDIIYVWDTGANYTQWCRDGLFLDLTPYLNEKDMPNAYAVLTSDELSHVTVDGAIYSLPRVQTKPMDIIMYRQDWLDAVGMDVPTTPAEFAAVAKAFTEMDPDGNGLNDTFGWSLDTVLGAATRALVSGFGIRPSTVPDENGVYTVMEAQPAYMDYLDWMREMYAAGSMNPEFYLTEANGDWDLWYSGTMGIRHNNIVVEHYVQDLSSTEWVDKSNVRLVAGPPLKMEGQEVTNVYYQPQIWGNWAISADCKDIETAIRVLDAGYSDAVNNILAFGVEGVTYTTFNDEEQYALKTPEQRANYDIYTATYATFNYQTADKGILIVNGDTQEEVDAFVEVNNAIAEQTNRISYVVGDMLDGVSEAMTAITDEGIPDKFNEMRTKYICGQIDRETMVDFLQNEYAPAYQPVLDIYAANGLNK